MIHDPSSACDLGFLLYSALKGEILGAVAAMKKGKSPGAGETNRARLRHRILLQDHEDLVEVRSLGFPSNLVFGFRADIWESKSLILPLFFLRSGDWRVLKMACVAFPQIHFSY